MRFLERAEHAKNPIAKKLFLLMEEKKTNLFVAADFTSAEEVLSLAEKLGPHIAGLKTHVDILEDFTPKFSEDLQNLAKKHHFLIFEDRKFADIGNTVRMQYQKGIYRIAEWADIINAHIVPGPGIIEGLKHVGLPQNRALILLAEMSPKGTFAKGDYTLACAKLAEEHQDFCIGFISLGKISEHPGFLHLTPGVKRVPGKDAFGQTYRTLEDVILHKKSDIIIVGRDIIQAENPLEAALLYQKDAWSFYEKRT